MATFPQQNVSFLRFQNVDLAMHFGRRLHLIPSSTALMSVCG